MDVENRVAGTRFYSLIATLLMLMLPLQSQAVDNLGLFQLDGNATQDGNIAVDDWQKLYNGGANTGGNSVAFTGIIPDPGQQTIFKGGRKDIQDISQWGWKNDGGFPDKNDITNAYAAAYVCPEGNANCTAGDLIVYFGADRYSNTGDAFMGFWFFKDNVTLNGDGTFNGLHQIGDILVLVNYPQASNAVPEIQVMEWNPALQDIGTNLHLLYSSSTSGVNPLCNGVGGDVCAITNAGDETSPWPYVPKSGVAGTFPYESFFEGGINLTSILGGAACFSSFMAETRSSTSVTATLKDFSLGQFPVCNIAVSKTCDVVRLTNANDPTDKYFLTSFNGTVTNTGAGSFPAGETLHVVDDAGTPNDASDDVVIDQVLASVFKPGDTIAFSGDFYTNDNPPFNTVHASLSFGSATVAAEPYSTNCVPLQLNPALSATKQCVTALETVNNLLSVRVDFNGQVCNDGDVPLSIDAVDNKFGTLLSGVMVNPGDCVPVGGSYSPVAANGNETCPGNASFSDTITVTGTSPVLPDPVNAMVTATCPLCLDCAVQ